MLLWRRRTTSPLNALVILKIQVHRDGGKEPADHRRFTLAANLEVYCCDPVAGPNDGAGQSAGADKSFPPWLRAIADAGASPEYVTGLPGNF
jgi:hypothetical protein